MLKLGDNQPQSNIKLVHAAQVSVALLPATTVGRATQALQAALGALPGDQMQAPTWPA